MEQAKDNQRIEWIEGVRGIACILIVIHHFLLAFYADSYYGKAVSGNWGDKFSIWWSQSPVSVMTNGNFWVCVFILISAFVLSLQIFQKDKFEEVQRIIFKRYFRMAIPIFVVSVIVQIMLMLRLFYNGEAASITESIWLPKYYTTIPSITAVFRVSFVSVLFSGDNVYSTAFWMIKYIFLGSYLAYILAICGKNKKREIFIFYLFSLWLFFRMDRYYCLIVLGVLVAHFICYEKKKLPSWFGYVCVLFGLVLGGYPSGVLPSNGYLLIAKTDYINIHIVGAFLFIIGILYAKGVQAVLSQKVFVWLGSISFAVYLIHIPILFSISCKVFTILYNKKISYYTCTGVAGVTTILFVLLGAWGFHKYIETLCNKVIVWIEKKVS